MRIKSKKASKNIEKNENLIKISFKINYNYF